MELYRKHRKVEVVFHMLTGNFAVQSVRFIDFPFEKIWLQTCLQEILNSLVMLEMIKFNDNSWKDVFSTEKSIQLKSTKQGKVYEMRASDVVTKQDIRWPSELWLGNSRSTRSNTLVFQADNYSISIDRHCFVTLHSRT